jgi:hypothetical protein
MRSGLSPNTQTKTRQSFPFCLLLRRTLRELPFALEPFAIDPKSLGYFSQSLELLIFLSESNIFVKNHEENRLND